MQMHLKSLSPVHIGTGQDLEPMEYVVREGKYVRVDMDAVMATLSNAELDRLTSWVSERADRMEAARDNARQSQLRREMNLLEFTREQLTGDLGQRLTEDASLAQYQARTGVQHLRAVAEQAKNPDGTPLVAGSSIKGALRTALAFQALAEMDDREVDEVVNGVQRTDIRGIQVARRGGGKGRVGQEVEKLVFRWAWCGRGRSPGSFADIHCDLMRAVHVGDAQPERTQLLVGEVASYARKRQHDVSAQPRLDQQAPMTQEMLAPGSLCGVRVSVDAKLLLEIHARLHVGEPRALYVTRVRRAFGAVAATAVEAGDEGALRGAVLQRLRTACQQFARSVAQHELKWAQTYNVGSLVGFYERLLETIEAVPVIRLGGASHFPSTTVMLALARRPSWNKAMVEVMMKFRIHTRGKPARTVPEDLLGRFPSARRLICIGGRPTAPLGWLAWDTDAARLPAALVDVEQLLQPCTAPRSTEQGRAVAGRGSWDGGRGRGHGQRRSQPARAAEKPLRQPGPGEKELLRDARRAQTRQAQERAPASAKRMRQGEKIKVEVLANDNASVRLRVVDSGAEIQVKCSRFPAKAGAVTKVRIVSVRPSGKVDKVAPA